MFDLIQWEISTFSIRGRLIQIIILSIYRGRSPSSLDLDKGWARHLQNSSWWEEPRYVIFNFILYLFFVSLTANLFAIFQCEHLKLNEREILGRSVSLMLDLILVRSVSLMSKLKLDWRPWQSLEILMAVKMFILSGDFLGWYSSLFR